MSSFPSPESQSPKNHESSSEASSVLRTSILLIHENLEFLVKHQKILEQAGYQVECANDGTEGLKKLYFGIPDLVIADMMVPEINGYQICRLIKNDRITKHIPFILISDFDQKIEKFWGIKAGADLFLHYDELEAKLLKQVSVLLEMYGKIDAPTRQQFKNSQHDSSQEMTVRLNQILDKALIESTLMIDFRNLVDMAHDPLLLNHMLFSFLESILDYDAAAIFYNDKTRTPRVATFHFPEGTEQHLGQIEVLKNAFFAPYQERFPQDPIFQLLDDEIIGSVSETAEAVHYQSIHSREYFHNNELIGALALYAKAPVNFENTFPVRLIEDEIGLLMKVRHIFSQSEMLAISDDLTGLANYHQFMIALDREFKASKRYEHPMTIALIDIDNFKNYNEQWGYLEGDEALIQIAKTAQQTFRASDVVARMGGEELIVLLPKTLTEDAMLPLERFKETVGSLAALKSPLSVSIGVCGLNDDIRDPSALLKQAREALDEAVRKGQNRIEVAASIVSR